MKSSTIVLYLASPLTSALVWEDGTGKLPAMGWNSWNTYLCDINATLFVRQAQAMLDHRLQVMMPLFGPALLAGCGLINCFRFRKPGTNM